MMYQARKLVAATQGILLIFSCRPESILLSRGIARSFVSPALLRAVPDIGERVAALLHDIKQHYLSAIPSPSAIAALNASVQRAEEAQQRAEEAQQRAERQLAREAEARTDLERRLAEFQRTNTN